MKPSKDLDKQIDEILIHAAKYVGHWDDVMTKEFNTRTMLTVDIPELKQALYTALAKEAEVYTVRINQSDGYEVTERAVPLSKIKEMFGASDE